MIKPHSSTFIAVAAVLFSGLLLGACGDCPDAFELSEEVMVRPDQRIVLSVPDGELTVMGRERSSMVAIEARGCRARAGVRIAEETRFDARLLEVVAPHANVRAWVPAGSEIEIQHGSGDMEVRAVGPALVATRGGDVRIEQVVGNVLVQAGPGTLYVREVVGDVQVMDGPGALFVENVMGSARIRDGSGGIHLREIGGDVVIDGDGDGSIDARNLGGSLTVRAKTDDERMIRWNDVAGDVTLPSGD